MTDQLDLRILATLISNKKNASEFISECGEFVFQTDTYLFAKQVCQYIKVYKDLPTLRTLIEFTGQDNQQRADYLKQTWTAVESVPLNDKEFKHDLKQIKDRYAESLLLSLRDNVFSDEKLHGDPLKNLSAIHSVTEKIKTLYKSSPFNQKTLKDSIKDFVDRYSAKQRDPNFGRGILTGYNFLDFQTNGLRPAELFLVAGESGSGKSMLLMNFAIQMWLQQNTISSTEFKTGYNILFFSLEMPYEQCLNRIVSRLADVPYRSIRDGTLTKDQHERVRQALAFIKRYPNEFEIVDIPRGATIEGIETIFNDVKARFHPDVVVVDYLGLMEHHGDMDDWLKLGAISGSLHEFARVYNVCVLSAVQLNRMQKGKDTAQDDKIGAHRIGRSALIIQNANVALQIEKRPEENMHPDMIVHIIKNRDGENVRGRLIKNFACCGLQNDPQDDAGEISGADDISGEIF